MCTDKIRPLSRERSDPSSLYNSSWPPRSRLKVRIHQGKRGQSLKGDLSSELITESFASTFITDDNQ